uniref:PHP domain-containing protein n=1 Tax=Alistipes sp. TaxID=1872444 RepID=UPI004056FFEF
MKKIVLSALTIIFALYSVSAQLSAVRVTAKKTKGGRAEIVIPQVKGYNVYKADFHTHSIYSDGEITPAQRVVEAWEDGLDIVAITDHIEYRPVENEILRYMGDYIRPEFRGGDKALNTNITNSASDPHGIIADLNLGSKMAKQRAQKRGIMVVKGAEITRDKLGCYNALFTKDNNAIYDANLETAIRNARSQDALIVCNAPRDTEANNVAMLPYSEKLLGKGLIDAIEVASGQKSYPTLYPLCTGGEYAPIAASNIHKLIDFEYPNTSKEYFRNMTLVLAERCDEESIKEAVRAKRTIAYFANMLVGSEELIIELFKASVEVEYLGINGKNKRIMVTNKSSLPLAISWGKGKEKALLGLSSIIFTVPRKNETVNIKAANMLYGKDLSPMITFELKK